MITILELFVNIVSIGKPTMIMIGLICGVVVWFSKDYLTNPILVICVWPLLFATSIAAYHIFVTLDYFKISGSQVLSYLQLLARWWVCFLCVGSLKWSMREVSAEAAIRADAARLYCVAVRQS
jgi:hypothetical protein